MGGERFVFLREPPGDHHLSDPAWFELPRADPQVMFAWNAPSTRSAQTKGGCLGRDDPQTAPADAEGSTM